MRVESQYITTKIHNIKTHNKLTLLDYKLKGIRLHIQGFDLHTVKTVLISFNRSLSSGNPFFVSGARNLSLKSIVISCFIVLQTVNL